jgi:hypothetical protein
VNPLTCCSTPSWVPDRDLGQAAGFDYLLGKCGSCGADWMNVFCVATSITGWEPVTLADVERMKAVQTGAELKALMRAWGNDHL